MGDGVSAVSSYPPPPPYYRFYSGERVAAGVAPPPPPVIQGTYTVFGRPLTTEEVEDNLENHPGRIQLFPRGEIQHSRELKKLNHAILRTYIDLLNVLVANQAQGCSFHDKVADLEQLFFNFHFLLNAFRPHQARETLISILTEQLHKRRALALAARTTFHEASQTLQEALQALITHEAEDLLKTEEAEEGHHRQQGHPPPSDETQEVEKNGLGKDEWALVEAEMDRLLAQIDDG